MTGWDYFKRAMTTDYANFSGRARRSEYWYFSLFLALFAIVITMLLFVLMDAGGSELFLLPMGILFLGVIVPSIAVTVRRLHDTGNSGWLYLLSLIPYVGSLIMLVFACMDSKPGPNKWGDNPKGIGNDDFRVTDHLISDDELV